MSRSFLEPACLAPAVRVVAVYLAFDAAEVEYRGDEGFGFFLGVRHGATAVCVRLSRRVTIPGRTLSVSRRHLPANR